MAKITTKRKSTVSSLKDQAPSRQTRMAKEPSLKNKHFAGSEPEEDEEEDDELHEESRPRKTQSLGNRRSGPTRVSDEYVADPGRNEAQEIIKKMKSSGTRKAETPKQGNKFMKDFRDGVSAREEEAVVRITKSRNNIQRDDAEFREDFESVHTRIIDSCGGISTHNLHIAGVKVINSAHKLLDDYKATDEGLSEQQAPHLDDTFDNNIKRLQSLFEVGTEVGTIKLEARLSGLEEDMSTHDVNEVSTLFFAESEDTTDVTWHKVAKKYVKVYAASLKGLA